MVIDVERGGPAAIEKLKGIRCLVDGSEVADVWYVDTEAGIVRRYDVLGDGLAHNIYEAGNERVPSLESLGGMGSSPRRAVSWSAASGARSN
jgi:hypothetical protein